MAYPKAGGGGRVFLESELEEALAKDGTVLLAVDGKVYASPMLRVQCGAKCEFECSPQTMVHKESVRACDSEGSRRRHPIRPCSDLLEVSLCDFLGIETDTTSVVPRFIQIFGPFARVNSFAMQCTLHVTMHCPSDVCGSCRWQQLASHWSHIGK